MSKSISMRRLVHVPSFRMGCIHADLAREQQKVYEEAAVQVADKAVIAD